jgi:hypothetical protein
MFDRLVLQYVTFVAFLTSLTVHCTTGIVGTYDPASQALHFCNGKTINLKLKCDCQPY